MIVRKVVKCGIALFILVVGSASCLSLAKYPLKYKDVVIFGDVKLSVPNEYQLISCNPVLRIKSYEDSDEWMDSLLFNPADSTFIHIHRYTDHSFMGKILLDPINYDSTMKDMEYIIDTSCFIKSFLFVNKVDTSSYEYQIDHYSCIVHSAFYTGQSGQLNLTFYFTKSKNESIAHQLSKALTILQTLQMQGETVCLTKCHQPGNAKNYTFEQWMNNANSLRLRFQ